MAIQLTAGFSPVQTSDGRSFVWSLQQQTTKFSAVRPDSFMISDFLLSTKFHTLSFFVREVCSVYFADENFCTAL